MVRSDVEMSEEKKELYRVVDRRIVTLAEGTELERKVVIVTFRPRDGPPETLIFPYEAWNPEREREVIIRRIREREQFKEEVVYE